LEASPRRLFNGSGKLFVNIEDKNEIVVVDLKTLKVERIGHWTRRRASRSVIDKNKQVVCRMCNKFLIAVNAGTGAVVGSFPIGDGCDGVGFDMSTKTFTLPMGKEQCRYFMRHLLIRSKPSLLLPRKETRTITVDSQTHLIYMPTADFEPQATPGQGRPRMIAGTFQVLVVGQ
jgi:hypothetical protein